MIWSEPAKADLQSIHQFIAHDSKPYANKVIQDLIAKTDVLDELPRIGKVVPELGSEEIRELSLYSYRILYEIKEPDIFVLGVIHRRRDLQVEEVHR